MEPSIVFHIGTFPIHQPVFWTWVIMALLSIASFILTRNLQKIPRGAQHFLEVAINWVESLITVDIGSARKVFVPLILMTALYVGVANMIGVIPGAYSPTEDLSTTLALALLIYVLGHVESIVKRVFRTLLYHASTEHSGGSIRVYLPLFPSLWQYLRRRNPFGCYLYDGTLYSAGATYGLVWHSYGHYSNSSIYLACFSVHSKQAQLRFTSKDGKGGIKL